jgi:CHAT domain-containing protein
MFVDADHHYAVEKHLIHLAVSGRDLLAPKPTVATTKPVIFADPAYDLAPGQALAKARELGRVPTATRGAQAQRSMRLSDFRRRSFEPLDGTRAEAKAVAPLMKAYTGAEPEVFLGPAASETVFKALHGPRVLVLSTHGFTLVGPEPAAAGPSVPPGTAPRGDDPAAGPANPLLRCGLALAGCNSAQDASNDNPDDGVLTGLEVVGSDLRGTELVVLSACETGLGEVRAGEGVAGLRQVFQLAGAGTVVASLWNVPDLESSQLMSAFFQGLARRRVPASALREAQLALIADRRAQHKAAHPYYWAAFGLTGSPGQEWRNETLVDAASPNLLNLDTSVSPVTGRPEAGSPWSDLSLAVALLFMGGFVGHWWWRLGATVAA